MDDLARTAAAILRTDRPLSPAFREQVAQMVEALDKCVTEMTMTETLHRNLGQPYYSDGLDAARKALSPATERE